MKKWGEVAPALMVFLKRYSNCCKLERIIEEGFEKPSTLQMGVLFLLPLLFSLCLMRSYIDMFKCNLFSFMIFGVVFCFPACSQGFRYPHWCAPCRLIQDFDELPIFVSHVLFRRK